MSSATRPTGVSSAFVVWCARWLTVRSCVPERFARLESHDAAERDLDQQQREDERADQRDRDVERREPEHQVFVKHVLGECDDDVGETEPSAIPISQPASATVVPSVLKIRLMSRAWARLCAPDHPPLIVPLPLTDLVTWAGLPV